VPASAAETGKPLRRSGDRWLERWMRTTADLARLQYSHRMVDAVIDEPLSFALTAPVAEALGVRTTLIAAGVLGALVTFACLFLPGMRVIEDREDAALAPEAAPSIT
jgi:hypothetical protein